MSNCETEKMLKINRLTYLIIGLFLLFCYGVSIFLNGEQIGIKEVLLIIGGMYAIMTSWYLPDKRK